MLIYLQSQRPGLGSEIDKSVISDITPQGYGFHHVSRHGKKGGGVALVYNSNLEVKSIRNEDQWSNFELLECSVTHRNAEFRIVVIYLPPPSKNNNFESRISSRYSQVLFRKSQTVRMN